MDADFTTWTAAVEFTRMRHGTFSADAVPWIAEILEAYHREPSSRSPEMLIRTAGHLLSPDELRVLGYRANAKLGDRLLGALTEKGHEYGPRFVAGNISMEASGIISRQNDLRDAARIDVPVELLTTKGQAELSCRAARRMAKQKRHDPCTAPFLPLPECTADVCGCLWISIVI